MYGLPAVEIFKFATAGLLTAVFGAQLVHKVYLPMDDLEELVQIELQKLREEAKKATPKS